MSLSNASLMEHQNALSGANRRDSEYGLSKMADGLFRRSQAAGRTKRLWSLLSGRSNRLKDLNRLNAYPSRSRRGSGIRPVGIDQIVGTQGRNPDFDRDFNPLKGHLHDRWISVARARLQGDPLPAVELIQVGDEYYVQDGHHRISVARALGEYSIDARVQVWQLTG